MCSWSRQHNTLGAGTFSIVTGCIRMPIFCNMSEEGKTVSSVLTLRTASEDPRKYQSELHGAFQQTRAYIKQISDISSLCSLGTAEPGYKQRKEWTRPHQVLLQCGISEALRGEARASARVVLWTLRTRQQGKGGMTHMGTHCFSFGC